MLFADPFASSRPYGVAVFRVDIVEGDLRGCPVQQLAVDLLRDQLFLRRASLRRGDDFFTEPCRTAHRARVAGTRRAGPVDAAVTARLRFIIGGTRRPVCLRRPRDFARYRLRLL